MKKFMVMSVCARFMQRCGHKKCVRREWLDRWYDYMFAVNGRERLEEHESVLVDFYSALNAGEPALLDLRRLRL